VRFWTFGLGLVPYAAVFGFRIWQPFTYIFLHGGILHILFNLLYLAMFGADLERALGQPQVLHVLLRLRSWPGVVDIIVKLLLDPHGRGTALVPTIGASGAIYGVLLAVA